MEMTYRRIIIDVYTPFANTLARAISKLKWAEDVSVGLYRMCPECSQVVVHTKDKTEGEVEEWLNGRTFKGFFNSWIGVVEDEGFDEKKYLEGGC
ncbi:MAG: hypothetical protein Q8M92_09430 [Candidatus Subteraquimicrobiales bacterium]|nr:hypothetical protein [Candidatus Subteraquimicrobiales bacterium]